MGDSPLHVINRNRRRVTGLVQAQRTKSDDPTTAAVLAAIKKAQIGRSSPTESEWTARIELLRDFLSASPERLDMSDMGTDRVRTLGEWTASSKPKRWAYLLFRLVRELRPTSLIELGSCVGMSAAYQGAALHLNGGGQLVTLEGSKALAARTERTITELGLSGQARVEQGMFDETLGRVLGAVAPVDWAFIDGHHDEVATLEYADLISQHAKPNAVFVFDDINWSSGMRKAWSAIKSDSRFTLTVDMRSVGLAVFGGSAERRALDIPYY